MNPSCKYESLLNSKVYEHKVLQNSASSVIERVVQDRQKLHLILQVFTQRRLSNLHFKSTHTLLRLYETTVCIGGHFDPDPIIL